MPVSFPGTSVAVEIPLTVLFTATFTDKDPRFPFFDLHPEQGGVLSLAGGTDLRLHGTRFGQKTICEGNGCKRLQASNRVVIVMDRCG